MLGHAVQLMATCKPPQLLEDGEMAENLKKVACIGEVARDVFYGRCLGFQVCFCLLSVSQTVVIRMYAPQHLLCPFIQRDIVY